MRSYSEVGSEITVKSTKTHQDRSVGLDADEVAMLAAHRAIMEARASTLGSALAAGAYVFYDLPDCSAPWSPVRVSDTWRKLCTRRGIKGTRLHDLRPFSATELLTAGVPTPDRVGPTWPPEVEVEAGGGARWWMGLSRKWSALPEWRARTRNTPGSPGVFSYSFEWVLGFSLPTNLL